MGCSLPSSMPTSNVRGYEYESGAGLYCHVTQVPQCAINSRVVCVSPGEREYCKTQIGERLLCENVKGMDVAEVLKWHSETQGVIGEVAQ